MEKESLKRISKKAIACLLSVLFLNPNNFSSFGLESIPIIDFEKDDSFDTNKINNLNINIKYRDAYNIDETWEKFKEIENARTSEIINYSSGNNLIDANSVYGINLNKLLKRVIYNNDTFINNSIRNSYRSNFLKYDEETLINVLETILSYIDDEVKTNKNITIEEMACKLYNLKILNGRSNPIYQDAKAEISNDYALIIYQDTIDESNMTDVDIKKIICHETEHFFQFSTPDSKSEDIKRENGSSFMIKDNNPVNSYWYRFLYESSAESMASSNKNLEPGCYKSEIQFLDLLKLCTISTRSNKIYSIEESQYELSFEPLYKIFNANSDEEKKEMHFMLLGFETFVENRNDLINNVRDEYNSNLSNDEIKKQVLTDSFKIATKFFYKNLIKTNSDYSLTIEDNFTLMKLYEENLQSNVNYYLCNDETMKNEINITFGIIQNLYFLYLESKYDIRLNSLIDNYQNYNINLIKINENLNWLPKEEKNFLTEFEKNKIQVILK